MPIIDFDVTTYNKPAANFDPLPAGDYLAVVSSSESKVTKAGTGEYIEFTMQIVDGDYKGRRIWERLNIFNANETAQDIARSALNNMAEACGIGLLKDTAQLHDVPMIVTLALDRKDPTRNVVRAYKKAGAAKPAVRASGSAGPAKMPWQR